MPKFATRPLLLAMAALLLVASQGSTAAAVTRPLNNSLGLRPCQGTTLSLMWGDYAWDEIGRCKATEPTRTRGRGTVKTTPVPRTQEPCPNLRSYLGGALKICPRAEPVART